MPKYSYIITEGYERSKVYIDEVLRKKLESIIESMDLNGVTSVNELPDSGEEGKIYYNTSDGKYYVYSDSAFKDVMGGVNIVTELPQTGKVGCIYYNSTDGKYYTWSADNGFRKFGDTDIPILSAEYAVSGILHTYVYGVVPSGSAIAVAYFGGSDDDFATGAEATSMPGGIGNDIILTRDPQGFYLEPGKFYNLGTINAETLDTEFETQGNPSSFTDIPGGLRLYCVEDSDAYVKEYFGKFTVNIGTASALNLVIDSYIGVVIPDDTPDFEDGHTYEFNVSASVLAIKDITYTGS